MRSTRGASRPPAAAFGVAPGNLVTIDTPDARSTVHDPLVVRGRIDTSLARTDVELMVDATPVANFLDAGYFDGDELAFSLPIPFVTEGAHTIWARRRGETSGWGHREVFLWRPDARGSEVRAADDALVVLPLHEKPSIAWPHVRWRRMRNARGVMNVGVADLRAMSPGSHDLGALVLQKL